MMSREFWCAEKSQQLRTEDNRIPVLKDIKEYISSLPHNEAVEAAHLLHLPLVFDCLNDSNVEQIELACEVLSICLQSLNVGESTSRYHADLERALNHPQPEVKVMALNEIQRNVSSDPGLEFTRFTKLLQIVIRCVGNEMLSIAKLACNVIISIGSSEIGISRLMSKDVRAVILEVMSTNEVVRLRFYDVFIDIAKKSESLKAALEATGFLGEILQELDSNDVLLRVNIIELLSQLVTSEHGYRYLENNGVIEKLCNSIRDTDDQMYVQLCEPGILKFFGHLAHHKPNVIVTKYATILKRLFDNILSDDFTIVGVSLDTLSFIVDTDEGKIAIDSVGTKFLNTIRKIVERLSIFPNEIKIRALRCIANLLNTNNNTNGLAQLTKKWYGVMEDNPMDWILRYAKNPFSELRQYGLCILNVLAKQLWGQEVIRNMPGLIEFLLDRNVETIKECKEMKFEIVKKLSFSPAFNHSMQLMMQAFVREGPFYVQGVTEIATEGNE